MFAPGEYDPLIREIGLPAELETCYQRISSVTPYAAFLNSGTDYPFARYSFIGCDPYLHTPHTWQSLKGVADGVGTRRSFGQGYFDRADLGADTSRPR